MLGRLKDWRPVATRYGPMSQGLPVSNSSHDNPHILVMSPEPSYIQVYFRSCLRFCQKMGGKSFLQAIKD